jgi:hypothetical protein
VRNIAVNINPVVPECCIVCNMTYEVQNAKCCIIMIYSYVDPFKFWPSADHSGHVILVPNA